MRLSVGLLGLGEAGTGIGTGIALVLLRRVDDELSVEALQTEARRWLTADGLLLLLLVVVGLS